MRGAAPGAGFEPRHIDKGLKQGEPGSPESAIATSRNTADIAKLEQMLDRASSARTIDSALSNQLRMLVPHDCFVIYLRTGDVLRPQLVGGNAAAALSMQQVSLGEGLSGWVAEHARPIVNGNPTVEPNCVLESGVLTAASSALSVPFFTQDGARNGSVLGVLTLYAAASAAFSKDHLGIVEALEARLSQAFQRALGSSRNESTTLSERETQTAAVDASMVTL